MKKHTLTKTIIKETKEAIKKFGIYSFNDKGPEEVMDLSPLVNEFKSLDLSQKIQIASDLCEDDQSSQSLLSIILKSNLSNKELDEILKVSNETINDYFE